MLIKKIKKKTKKILSIFTIKKKKITSKRRRRKKKKMDLKNILNPMIVEDKILRGFDESQNNKKRKTDYLQVDSKNKPLKNKTKKKINKN